MSNYKDYKKKVLQNPEIKSEYDALQPEYDIITTKPHSKRFICQNRHYAG